MRSHQTTTSGRLTRQREATLIRAARRGNEQACRELVEAHQDRLFSFVWRVIRDPHDAEEICQEAFLRAFAALDSFSVEYRFSTWLFTIAHRLCLNRLRKRTAATGGSWESLPDYRMGSDEQVAESEEAARLKRLIWGAVDRLSDAQREVVLLFYREGQSCQEISRILGMPVATVKSHLHRARAKLRAMLEPAVPAGASVLQARFGSA